jgi:hypothetical protein
MTGSRLRTLVALDAAGALPAADRALLHRQLAAVSGALRHELAALYDSAAALPAAEQLGTPSPDVRARILSHAARGAAR